MSDKEIFEAALKNMGSNTPNPYGVRGDGGAEKGALQARAGEKQCRADRPGDSRCANYVGSDDSFA